MVLTKRLAISSYMSNFLPRPDITIDGFIFSLYWGLGSSGNIFFVNSAFHLSGPTNIRHIPSKKRDQWIHIAIENPSNVKILTLGAYSLVT